MDYTVDRIYEFPVGQAADINEDFFRIILEEGQEVRLPKFRYQQGKPLPSVLPCRVKMMQGGVPVLSHVPAWHVFRLYGDRPWQRESYDFCVRRLPQSAGGPYELIDDNGILYRLYDRDARLTQGQKVRCRFERITPTFFQITRDYDEDALQYLSPDDALAAIEMSPSMRRFLLRFIATSDHLATARAEQAEMRAGWIVSAMQALRAAMADMFATARVPRNARALQAMFETQRAVALMLLEDSEFMRNAVSGTRASMQGLLTEIAESVEPYLKAIDLITRGSDESYVMGLMEKLRKSGYLYHPKLQFATMMAIFRLKPGLIRKALGRIYDAVMQWRLDTWVAEPFRSAFVEQFEIYVDDARHRIDALPQVESEEDFANLENVLTAIALQLHIADAEHFAGYGVNRSRLYRYAALARPRAVDALLDKAYYALVNGGKNALEYSYDSIRNYTMMVTSLATPLHGAQRGVETPRVYRAGHISVEAGADGIAVRRTDDTNPHPVLPNGMMSWLAPQVWLDGVAPLSAARMRQFQAHQELWKQVELALLEERSAAAPHERLAKAEPGDTDVEIRVVGAEPDRFGSNPHLICEIVDPSFESGRGYLYRSDVVDYKVKEFDRRSYTDSQGRPLRFWADIAGVDADGNYRFSLKRAADYAVRNVLANRMDEIVAVITATDGPRYSALGDHGFGFYVERHPDFLNIAPGTYLRVRMKDIPLSGSIVAEIVDYAREGESVCKDDTLVHLMRTIGEEADGVLADSDDIIRDADEILGADELMEIIEMLRFKALSAPKLLEAVDYLGLARVLAAAVGDESTAEMLRTHMALLGQHQFYADNTRIDSDALDALEASATANPLLERIFTRLRIVSKLGCPDALDTLTGYVAAPRNELEGTLARLVCSYNMLAEGAIESDDDLRFIKRRIAALLGVNNETHHLKHYGSESQYVEFKSSLVFPAAGKGRPAGVPDKERQHQEILQIIAGFLNSTGGTLFVGVNDQHYEKGLQDDFAHLPKNVRTMDNLCVYLDNLVRNSYDLGATVGNYVHISTDEESERGVLVVKVDPSRRPVMLGGNIFVRQSSSTVPMLGDDRRIFIADRERRYDEMMRIAGVEPEPQAADAPAGEGASMPAGAPAAAQAAPQLPEAAAEPGQPGVATSLWRRNVLHDYEDGFVAPACYLYFMADGTVRYSRSDIYLDTDPACELALAVSPAEASGGWLLLAFDDARAARVPLREVLEKPENTPLRYYDGSALRFAAIGRAGDALMSVLADSNDGLSARCTPLERLDECRLGSAPDRVVGINIARVHAWELVAASAMQGLANYCVDNLSSRQAGYTMRVRAGQPEAEAALARLFDSCKPQSL
ncbi:MAG: ATP-binding protein [Muribaculaceae bacterium]|nr:ATP-binding protein [Muribaculaceae bacterium]